MKIYHGHASPADLAECRDAAPSHEHGIEWSDPLRMVKRDEPYIVDNGAYSNDGFSEARFKEMLGEVENMPRKPEWVVLPDKLDNWQKTRNMNRSWYLTVNAYGYDYYAVGQPPATSREIVELANEIGAGGIFLGGSDGKWKFDTAAEIQSYPVHIGSPGLGANLTYARKVCESVDTTSIVVHDYWHHLERLETETTLQESTQ